MPEEKFIARRSAWRDISFLLILLCILIIPIFIVIAKVIIAHHQTMEIEGDKITLRSGVLSRHENNVMLAGVMAVSVNQSLKGRMFHFGDVHVDIYGKNDLNLAGVKHPEQLKEFLQKYIDAQKVKTVVAG